ncbi:hypothetical protein Y032_0460g1860 [Ancylostoma ceylanicum]|nr:hypothetical protein Y032_0460g1860 [Ancylostoma ceylanicum]
MFSCSRVLLFPGQWLIALFDNSILNLKKWRNRVQKVLANDLVQSVENHEKELHAKFEKYLEGRSRSTSLDVARLELEREQRCHAEAESEIVCAEQSVVKAEKREQVRVDKLKSSATALQKSGIDVAKEQSMREMYQDMIDKLAEMCWYANVTSHFRTREGYRSDKLKIKSYV